MTQTCILAVLLAAFVAAGPLAGQDVATPAPDSALAGAGSAIDRLLDRIVLREKTFLESLARHTPLFETYIQELSGPGGEPAKDHYFLGRVQTGETIGYETLVSASQPEPATERGNALVPFLGKSKSHPLTFLPRGFAQMAIPDLHGFNRTNYAFQFVRREFLGEVRCLVFDISPVRREPGRFLGRIWVEEQDSAIVRFNGTYIPAPAAKNQPPALYFHFDSWRVNVAPGEWIPAQIYVEEEGSQAPGGAPRFKAQTRIWDYAAAPGNKLDELTQILVEAESGVRDSAAPRDASPLESQRAWEHQAEENVLQRLEAGGLLAPPGPVDEVLNTVVNNLIVSAKLPVEARCRVLLTTPFESFSIGHTIVISRGLIDVLPDETSLALVLADELSHIALGHRTPTQFAFTNQTMMSDAELLKTLRFERTPEEMEDAGHKTIEIMRASPYQKVANAGLFLKALAARGTALPRLLAANLGNQVANADALRRLEEFITAAPELEENQLEQIAALPLGSRVKLDPFDDHITLMEAKPIALLSPREKMPFEVTPFVLFLTRATAPEAGEPPQRRP